MVAPKAAAAVPPGVLEISGRVLGRWVLRVPQAAPWLRQDAGLQACRATTEW